MITNQRQYLVAQSQAERFRQALAAPDAQGLHPKAARAMRAGLRSQLDDIEAELAEYDALSQGQVTELEAESSWHWPRIDQGAHCAQLDAIGTCRATVPGGAASPALRSHALPRCGG